MAEARSGFEQDPGLLGLEVGEESFFMVVQRRVESVTESQEEVGPIGGIVADAAGEFFGRLLWAPAGVVHDVTRPAEQSSGTAVGHRGHENRAGAIEGLQGGVQPAFTGKAVGFSDEDEWRQGSADPDSDEDA